MKGFLAAHHNLIKTSLLTSAAAIISIAAMTATIPVGLVISRLACPALPTICSGESGLVLFGLGSTILLLGVTIGALRFIVKVRWLTAIEASLLSVTFAYATVAVLSSIYQADAPPLLVFTAYAGPFMFLMVVTVQLFRSLRSWQHGIIFLAIAACIVAPWLLRPWTTDLHSRYQLDEGIRSSQKATFQIYSPRFLPSGYELVMANRILASDGIPEGYTMTYQVSGQADARSADQPLLLYQKNADTTLCDNTIHAGCEAIGRSVMCEVYKAVRTDDPAAYYYCRIGQTLIELTDVKAHLSLNQILEVFGSMKPGVNTTAQTPRSTT